MKFWSLQGSFFFFSKISPTRLHRFVVCEICMMDRWPTTNSTTWTNQSMLYFLLYVSHLNFFLETLICVLFLSGSQATVLYYCCSSHQLVCQNDHWPCYQWDNLEGSAQHRSKRSRSGSVARRSTSSKTQLISSRDNLDGAVQQKQDEKQEQRSKYGAWHRYPKQDQKQEHSAPSPDRSLHHLLLPPIGSTI